MKSTSSGRSTASTGVTSLVSTARRSRRSAGGNTMNRVLSHSVVVIALVLGGASSARAADSPANESGGASSTSSSASENASAGPECIGDKAKKSLETCPAGPTLSGVHGKEPQMSFHSKVEEIKKGDKKIEIGKADVSMIAGYRDLRTTRLKQRVLALLITEIGQLEMLLHETDLRSKDRPVLLRRLAEDYVELENAAFKEKTEAEIARDEAKGKKNNAEAGKQQAIATSRKTTMERARKAAVQYYSVLVGDYAGQPSNNFPQNPPPANPNLDEIYYYLAYEYEQAGDTVNARRVYLDLITKTPNSKYLTNAYLAFGELFFRS